MPHTPSVIALVVTHNRRELLVQCLERISAQTRRPDGVLVIDNASDDGTVEMLGSRDDVEVLHLSTNIGGAGGFHAGLQVALEHGYTWSWLMDDDTMAAPDALEALLAASTAVTAAEGAQPLVLASRVEWTDGTLHPMNRPWPKSGPAPHVVDAAAMGLMPLRAASFVSVLIHREAVLEHGLPHAEYFIYNDDLEYTARILRRGLGYWVPASLAVHATGIPRMPLEAGSERYFFDVRNRLLMVRGQSWSPQEKWVLLHHLLHGVRAYLRANRFAPSALITVGRALLAGLSPQRTQT